MPMIQKLPIPYEEIRSLVLKQFQNEPETQYVSVCNGVAKIAVDINIVQNPHHGMNVSGDTFVLIGDDQENVRQIIWDLIIERVITIGINSGNSEWPFLKLTEYGQQVIASERPIPHDPSGYLEYINNEIPNLNPDILLYLQEAIRSYNIGSLLASMVMLGCAAEKSLLLLIESFIKSLPNEIIRKKFKSKIENRFIKKKYDEFSKILPTYINQLPRECTENIQNVLLGVFEIIRNVRNDSGHPTGRIVSKAKAFALLQIFIEYCKIVYGLIDFFNNNELSEL